MEFSFSWNFDWNSSACIRCWAGVEKLLIKFNEVMNCS